MAEAQPNPEGPPATAEPPRPTARKPLDRPQTEEELAFYAKNYFFVTICALLFFPPLGLGGLYFSRQTDEANKHSDWEDAYRNSARTMWVDVFSILIGLAFIYIYVLVL